jgi:hypothetical protein
MLLHEAIRLGSMTTVQGFGSKSIESKTAPCALGAAGLACGLTAWNNLAIYELLKKQWPILCEVVMFPPGLSTPYKVGATLLTVIYILNDTEKWNREQIADWVQTIEGRTVAEGTVEVPVQVPVPELALVAK